MQLVLYGCCCNIFPQLLGLIRAIFRCHGNQLAIAVWAVMAINFTSAACVTIWAVTVVQFFAVMAILPSCGQGVLGVVEIVLLWATCCCVSKVVVNGINVLFFTQQCIVCVDELCKLSTHGLIRFQCQTLFM